MKKTIKSKFKEVLNVEEVKYLVKNSRFKLIYRIILYVGNFFITFCFANFTSTIFYGRYLFITSVISFAYFLSFAGFNEALLQSTASGYDRFLITALKKKFYYSLIGSLSLVIFAIFYSILFEENFIIFLSLTIGAIFFPFDSATYVNFFFLDGKGKFKKELAFRLIYFSLRILLLLLLIFLIKDLIIYFLILYGIQSILNVIFTKYCIKMIENKKKIIELEIKSSKFGFFLTKYGIISIITININSIIIGLFFGANVLAVYTIGIGLITTIISLLTPSLSVLTTRYAQKRTKLSKKFLFFLLFGSIIMFICINLTLPFYFKILFPNYFNSISYGIAYSFIILIYPLQVILGSYFRGKTEKKVIKYSSLIPDVFYLISLYPLILIFEIYGFIIAEFLKAFIRLIIYLSNFKIVDFN